MNELKTGLLLLNKSCGMTSFGCIKYLKRIIKQKVKIGHAGTLDPFATGLLIIALGRQATRLMPVLMTLEKTYVAQAKLGELTDTLDHTGTIVETINCAHITENDLRQALLSFGSSYEQTPPLYSALKHQGNPLYKLARQGIIEIPELVDIAKQKTKTVQLYQLELISFHPPFFTIQARVSHGTYIRSLLNDIAQKLNNCATTYTLERTAIGEHKLSHAINIADINTVDDILAHVIST